MAVVSRVQIISRTTSNDAYAWTGAVNADRAYAANGLNQYTGSGSVTPTYDGRGNLTSAGSATYAYDTRDQLYTTGSGGLFYRPPTGLLSQLLWPTNSEAFAYAGDKLVTEVANGSILRRYVYGPGMDEPLVWYEGSGTSDRRFLHADERGSIVAVSDNGGSAIAINTYDEYGIPGTNNIGRFQYTGQRWLPELGMYDYKARVYSPTLGRFLQADPIGYADGMNRYNYVGGDPVNFKDPSGLFCADGSSGGDDKGCAGHGGYVPGSPFDQPDGPDVYVNGHRCEAVAGCFQTSLDSLNRNVIITIPGEMPFAAEAGDIVIIANRESKHETCAESGDDVGSTVVDRVGDAHGSIFAAGQTMASQAGNEAGAASIGRAALPEAVLLGGFSEGIGAASDRAAGMSAGRAAAIHGTGFVGGLLGGFALGEAVEPLGGGIVGAIIAGIAGGYGGSKIGEATGAAAATKLGYCK